MTKPLSIQFNESVAARIAALMPGGDDRTMWREFLATALEHVAATDDLSLLREAKAADLFEVEFMDFVSNFPGLEIQPAPEGGFYGVALGLAKFDRELREKALRAYAEVLRKSPEICHSITNTHESTMQTDTQHLQTLNPKRGFWGTMAHQKKAREAWPLAMASVAVATNRPPEAVREFLDSRDGRHFADQVVLSLHQGLSLPDAIAEAVKCWMTPASKSAIFSHLSAETTYLDACIQSILDEIEE